MLVNRAPAGRPFPPKATPARRHATRRRGRAGFLRHEDVPAACGRSTPLARDHALPTGWRDAAGSGWGLDLPEATAPPIERTAVELLTDVLDRNGVTLLTLGPLTNVAEAFRAHPELAQRLSSIVVMGGAVDVPGNGPARGR
jgi:inosine-uridine nucleoside N-ribohydrolase